MVGSEVPNLMQPGAASTLVVSLDLDIGVPVHRLDEVKERLTHLRDAGFAPSADEPSVWVSQDAGHLELNFVGIDPGIRDAADTYVLEDSLLPLMVFGPLGFVRRGRSVDVDGIAVPIPEPSGLALEKLVTDRSGDKGDRDLLVALGLLGLMSDEEISELVQRVGTLSPDLVYAVRTNLTLLSLLKRRRGMPDPVAGRELVNELLTRLSALSSEHR